MYITSGITALAGVFFGFFWMRAVEVYASGAGRPWGGGLYTGFRDPVTAPCWPNYLHSRLNYATEVSPNSFRFKFNLKVWAMYNYNEVIT